MLVENMKKVIVTGANGFIGKNLCEKLNGRYEIYTATRENLDLLDTEQTERFFKDNFFDIVIHTANANRIEDMAVIEYGRMYENLRIFFNLERCKRYYGKMYYFGSGAEYDMQHYIPNMEEEYFDIHLPRDPYGLSKYIMSKVCSCTNSIFDLRLFGVYGRYERWEYRFISNAICRALKGKDIIIQKNVYFDYLWIDDLCEIMCWFMEHTPKYKHYNVCSGRKIDLYSLAYIIRECLHINCDIVVKEKGLKLEYTGSNQKLIAEMGEYSFTGYEESIFELCGYYRTIIDQIDESKLL